MAVVKSIYFTKPDIVDEWAKKHNHTFNKAVNLMCYGYVNQLNTLDDQYNRICQLEEEVEKLTQAVTQLKAQFDQKQIGQMQNVPGGL